MRNSRLLPPATQSLPPSRWAFLAQLKKISGKECIKILCNRFGFRVVRQKGSHIVLRKESPSGSRGASVPNHPELRLGTLKGILEQAGVSEEEFARFL
ncbi:MAG: type II toxin-antitoxin system HicA family toxin [Thermoplasmatota archaeon]